MTAAPPHVAPTAPAYTRMFAPGRLTLGVFFAIESYPGDTPTMADQLPLARRAEEGGFAALWTRDVPLRDPSFGDVGQIFDPWVWMGLVLGQTQEIALATGSIVLPLRHPLHTAKAAASVDALSGGRLFLGVASGDRPVEFPAFGLEAEERGARFRESLALMEAVLGGSFPTVESRFGRMQGVDLLPKPSHGRIPIGVTGSSRQSLDWIAEHADAWVMYPRDLATQRQVVAQWRETVLRVGGAEFKPFAQSLYIDLVADRNAQPRPIHLGFRCGITWLVDFLGALQEIGVNHVVLNLKYGSRPAREVLEELSEEVVPHFPAHRESLLAPGVGA